MFINIKQIFTSISEILQPDNSFITKTDINNLTIKNALITDKGIILRKGIETNSYISINKPKDNEMDSFSLELIVPNPQLKFPENYDLNLFLTENELPYKEENNNNKYETYRNISSKFHGINISITFKGSRLSIIVGYNTIENIYTDFSYIVQDNLDPKRYLNIKIYKFKYIFTPENIKIEIYNNETNELIYDKLRFTDKNIFGDLKIYKYITITNTFFKIPSDKHLEISNIKLYKRLELENYDKHTILTKPIDYSKREINEINHESEEIQFLISNLEHFMFYLKLILGETDGTSLNNKVLNLRRIISNNSTSLNQLIETIDELKIHTKQNSLSNLNQKLSNLESKIIKIERLLIDSNLRISNIKDSHWLGVKTIIIFGLLMFVLYLALNLFYEKFLKNKMKKID